MWKDGKELDSTTTKFFSIMQQMSSGSEESGMMIDISMLESMFGSKSEGLDSPELLKSQYELVGANSRWPSFTDPSEVIIVLDRYNQVPDYVLPELGLIDVDEILFPAIVNLMRTMSPVPMTEEDAKYYVKEKFSHLVKEVPQTDRNFDINKVVGSTYKISLPYEGYRYKGEKGVYENNPNFTPTREIKVVGVVRPKEGATGGALQSGLVYTKALTDAIMHDMENAPVIMAQKADREHDVLTGKPFSAFSDGYSLNMTEKFGYVDKNVPSSISFYVSSFEDRSYITEIINQYNAGKADENKIESSDFLGSMMSGITDIIDAVSYVLIGFVSVSLIVSSIMIGIITYISVLERIKEIGILRALGASKKDVSRVFNAETLIIGLTAGLLGIGVTVLLNLPISFIIYKLAEIRGVSRLPWLGGILLVLISMGLTLLAGLIPSKIASKKDPVVALRTE